MTHSGGITAKSSFLLAKGVFMPTRKATSGRVTVIVPHYNQKECLKTLLPSIASQTFKDYEAIVIDDCTPDRSAVEYIKDFAKDHQKVHLVENAENMRFVRTVNKGIKLATGEYICLLNSDTEVKENFIERNVEILDANAAIGALSCVVVDHYGQNWFCGGRYNHGAPFNLTDDFEEVRSVDFVAGTAAFYRREVFDSIGLFDENYGMYHEDVEFGLRLHAQTNYRACMFPDKLVTHFVVPSIPSSDKVYYGTRNAFLLARRYAFRHLPRLLACVVVFGVCKPLVTSIAALLTAKPFSSWRSATSHAVATTKGMLHGLTARQSRLGRQHSSRK
jgi:GT2 family glycosyltransferase